MKKYKIGDIILWSILILFLINTLIAYISYRQVSENKEPTISFAKKTVNKKVIYNEGIYNVIVKEYDKEKEVSLKLFFLK